MEAAGPGLPFRPERQTRLALHPALKGEPSACRSAVDIVAPLVGLAGEPPVIGKPFNTGLQAGIPESHLSVKDRPVQAEQASFG